MPFQRGVESGCTGVTPISRFTGRMHRGAARWNGSTIAVMRHALIAGCALALVIVGCGKAEVSRPVAAATPAAASEEARLVAADLADGAEDHVVSKCAVCNLSMDGKPEFASTYSGYSFHLCSAHCKETFDHDPAKVVARIAPAT